MDDLIEKFSLEKLNPSPAAINFSKLDHFNKLHIKNLPDEDLARRIQPFFDKEGIEAPLDKLSQIVPVIKERLITLDESITWCKFLFTDDISVDGETLMLFDKTLEESASIADDVCSLLGGLPDWNVELIETSMRDYMETASLSPKQLFSFIRNAISGQKVTPPLFDCMVVMGKEKTMQRLEKATKALASM
jgi:glutamyl-tRNA synthetase